MKKVWIAIAGTVAALAVVLLIIGLASPKKITESGDEGSSYQYRYEKTKEGLLIHITGDFPDSSRWVCADSSGAVAVSEKKQNVKKADFLIAPTGVGGGSVRFSLQREADALAEQLYQITVELVVSIDAEISVLRNYHSEGSEMAAETGDAISYQAAPQSDGTLAVLLDSPAETEWDIEVDGESVVVFRDDSAEEERLYRIVYRSLGQSTVYLCRRESTQAVRLYVTTDLNEQVRLVESAIVDHVYTEHSTYAELFDGLFGTISLPSDAKNAERTIEEWVSRADNVTRLRTGCIRFSLGGLDWTLYISRQGSTDDFIADFAGNNLEQRTISVNDISTDAYLYEGGGAAVWTDPEGRHYMLRGETVTMEQLAAAVEEMIGVIAVG